MEIIKKHVDTVIILGAVISSVLWMNGKFNSVDVRFGQIEKDVAIIKTIMILKNIMPPELIHKDE
jgi:hypothetical protein